jgi:putative ABC transport system permease protein
VLGAPAARLGVAGVLGRGNAVRSPRRTSATAAALMVGLALVSAVSVLGASVKASVDKVIATSLGADVLIVPTSFQGFSPTVADELRGEPAVGEVLAVLSSQVELAGEPVDVSGMDPGAAQAVLKLDVLSGDLDGIADGGVALDEGLAHELGLSVGDRVPLAWPRTAEQEVVVSAIYATHEFMSRSTVSEQALADGSNEELLEAVGLTVAEGSTPAELRAAVEAVVADLPTVEVQDRAEFAAAQRGQVDQLLNVVIVLLVLSVVIAVLGIVNTLALSVVERTRELGLLRAVGLQRRQLRRMIRVESVVIALYGAVLGLLVGSAFGWALVRALRDQGITELAVPGARLAVVVVVAAAAGVLAAALPARRAARLDVLQAVAPA